MQPIKQNLTEKEKAIEKRKKLEKLQAEQDQKLNKREAKSLTKREQLIEAAVQKQEAQQAARKTEEDMFDSIRAKLNEA